MSAETTRNAIHAYNRLRMAVDAAQAKARFEAIATGIGISTGEHFERDMQRIAKEANAAIAAAGLTRDDLATLDAIITAEQD